MNLSGEEEEVAGVGEDKSELVAEESRWLAAWHEPEHAEFFSAFPRRYSRRTLIQHCRQFNEGKLLEGLSKRVACPSISDIGCGTGLFYSLLASLWPTAAYAGFDISAVVLERARAFYPEVRFLLLDRPLTSMPEAAAELVFSRDVLHHQTDPLGFLRQLYDMARHYLVVRIRTREQGATVYDLEQSCQYSYGHWIPFIVINTTELIDRLLSFSPTPMTITVRRHPVVLGGQNGRFLPKELYEPQTGTAETAVLIEKGQPRPSRAPTVDVAISPEVYRESLLYEMGRRIARRIRI